MEKVYDRKIIGLGLFLVSPVSFYKFDESIHFMNIPYLHNNIILV